MAESVYEARFVGGPWDGVIYALDRSTSTVTFYMAQEEPVSYIAATDDRPAEVRYREYMYVLFHTVGNVLFFRPSEYKICHSVY